MRKPFIRASVVSLVAGLCVIGTPAEARRVRAPAPAPTPAPGPSNLDEWSLIGLTSTLATSASGGAGVTVAVLDGLTDCRDTDLAGRCTNFQITGGVYTKYDNHGTHTAGIVAGTKYGVATSSRILNYGVFDDTAWVAGGTKLVGAWLDAASKGATIASMSFGCSKIPLCFGSGELNTMADPNVKLLYVKAAGNDGTALLNESIFVSRDVAVAALARTIIVGSVDVNGAISSFSNRAGNACLMYSGATGCTADNQWKYHFLVAPGSSIYSTLPNNAYGYMSGTSMATPVVAGAASLLEAKWPALKTSPETVAQILFSSATDLGIAGVDATYGWGLLNVTRAFQAAGNVTLVSPTGTTTTLTGKTTLSSPTLGGLAGAMGKLTVYDRFGRDFALSETNAVRTGATYSSLHPLLGRRLIGLGSQKDWSAALFAREHQPLGFGMFSSPADPTAGANMVDQSLRMGVDMPFGQTLVQVRMTGATASRADFAYDPSLKALSFFASSDLLRSSLFGQALFGLTDRSRLAVYGTTNSAGTVNASQPDLPLFLQTSERSSMTRLALTGSAVEQKQYGFGAGYWLQPDAKTVVGFNASYLSQSGGYYDLVSDLPGFDRQTHLVNLGAVASRSFGSWDVSAAGEVSHVTTTAAAEAFRLTPANIASAELRLRKAGIGFAKGAVQDSLSLALVMPPRAVSGSIKVDYMTRTEDGLGRRAASQLIPLSSLGENPVKAEAAYRIGEGTAWSLDLTGGYNLERSDYLGRGEALASLHLAL